MGRYVINLRSGVMHDRRYSQERCQLDDAKMTAKTWVVTDIIYPGLIREIPRMRTCLHCKRQERYEMGNVTSVLGSSTFTIT